MEDRDQRERPFVEPKGEAIGGDTQAHAQQRATGNNKSIEPAQTIDVGLNDFRSVRFVFGSDFNGYVVFSIQPPGGNSSSFQQGGTTMRVDSALERGHDDPGVSSGAFSE